MARKVEQTSIDDLYFGIMLEDFNAKDDGFLRPANLFNIGRVKWSIAYWITSDDKFRKEHDLIRWCFGSVWGRREYEFVVSPLISNDDRAMKVNTFRMYVEPNAKLLRQMVDSVSVASANRYLAEERKRINLMKNMEKENELAR